MARLPRIVLPGQPLHVIIRGNNREAIFCQDADYHYYLEKLTEASEKHGCEIHAYVLMTNHVHLLISPLQSKSGLSKCIQMLGRYYVQYFNYSYGRTGTLWEGRFKSTLVDSERYLLTCYRYIELNPVRAQMVAHPVEYPWSSYRANALGESNRLITPHNEYVRLGTNDITRQSAYRQLFAQCIPEKTLDEIRTATNKAWVLGSDVFKSQIEQKLKRAVSPRARGGDRRSEAYREGGKINRV